jgi:hypothetical protein
VGNTEITYIQDNEVCSAHPAVADSDLGFTFHLNCFSSKNYFEMLESMQFWDKFES